MCAQTTHLDLPREQAGLQQVQLLQRPRHRGRGQEATQRVEGGAGGGGGCIGVLGFLLGGVVGGAVEERGAGPPAPLAQHELAEADDAMSSTRIYIFM